MLLWLLRGSGGGFNFLHGHPGEFNYQQNRSLVNVKLKWVKDKTLDSTISGERDVRAASILVSIISSDPHSSLPVYRLSRHRRLLGIPPDLKLSTFIRRYPTIFHEFHALDSGGTRIPWFRLTPEALDLHKEELNLIQKNYIDLINRLCKVLMLTRDRTLPLQTIDQLKWDLGLPYDFEHSLIPQHPDLFCLTRLPDDRVGLRLVNWDETLAVSHLQKNVNFQQMEEDVESGTLGFPIGFTRGYGLKRKCMEWLKEWQKLPYTSPYHDASHLDRRTDVSEKRIVGIFHELLHLTVQKRTERKNVSNLRKPLGLPQKFTKVFERHPGIFYISKKCNTQTVVLREAYDGQRLVEKHPAVEIRERFGSLMREGVLGRSRGLYKRTAADNLSEIKRGSDHRSKSEGESDCDFFSEYDSDYDVISDPF